MWMAGLEGGPVKIASSVTENSEGFVFGRAPTFLEEQEITFSLFIAIVGHRQDL